MTADQIMAARTALECLFWAQYEQAVCAYQAAAAGLGPLELNLPHATELAEPQNPLEVNIMHLWIDGGGAPSQTLIDTVPTLAAALDYDVRHYVPRPESRFVIAVNDIRVFEWSATGWTAI